MGKGQVQGSEATSEPFSLAATLLGAWRGGGGADDEGDPIMNIQYQVCTQGFFRNDIASNPLHHESHELNYEVKAGEQFKLVVVRSSVIENGCYCASGPMI
jgi:hypothetical protein